MPADPAAPTAPTAPIDTPAAAPLAAAPPPRTGRRVVIVGGGFGGLAVARRLADTDLQVTLIDRSNHHLFQPLLYQVASAALAPADIAEPIRSIIGGHDNVEVRLAEVEAVQPTERRLILRGGEEVGWDWLVLAAGARHGYFGRPEWEVEAPGLKTLPDALEIRRRVLLAFEQAEWETDPHRRAALMTFVVVGGGPTGVELAGSIADIASQSLPGDFRRVDTRQTKVVLIEAGPSVLGSFAPPLREAAAEQLRALGVELRLGAPVEQVDEHGVVVKGERISAETVLWAAGNEASPLGRSLGVPLDRAGRVIVGPDLSVEGHPDLFVIGDQAHVEGPAGLVPGVAPAAQQMGRLVARNILADHQRRPRKAFSYRDKGSMATIGRSKAVAQLGRLRLRGYLAWLLWAVVHLATISTFRNRAVVFIKWGWAWFTFDRSSRIVWTQAPVRPPRPPEG
ncbi:MAG: hypothetical protein RL071_1238 [Pseudomonadota bacterium]|jgi:NADH dehydrogenase